jgi:hypothetical protein
LRIMNHDGQFSCGGLVFMGIYRWAYSDFQNCIRATWRFLSYHIEQEEAWAGQHKPGSAVCQAGVSFKEIE